MAIVWKLRNLTLLACLWIASAPVAWGFSDTESHWAGACIEKLQERQLVSGYPDGTFRPNSTITRTEFAVLMLNTFPDATQNRNPIAFKDVPESYWGYNAIRDAYRKAFFSGYPDSTFKPRLPIPRVQALAVLANALYAYPIPGYASGYSHLERVSGTDNIPENYEQILQQYFNDALEIPNYAKRAIASAAILRLTVNYPNIRQLEPHLSATRGDVAAFICQALNLPRTVPIEYLPENQSLAIPPELGIFGYPFSEGLAVAEIDGKYGYIDKSGEFAIAPQFDSASSFAEGLAAVTVGDKWGLSGVAGKTSFIDKQGNLAIELTLEDVQQLLPESERPARRIELGSFSEGLALVDIVTSSYKNYIGYIDKNGKFVIPPQPYEMPPQPYEMSPQLPKLWNFSEGLAVIVRDDKYGYIDKTGKIVIEPQFFGAMSFSEGLAPVLVREPSYRWGYIDKTGKMTIEPQFYRAQEFSEGLAGVSIQGGWGFIDKTGSAVIPGQFSAPSNSGLDGVEPFSGGLAVARLGEKAGFIDKTGKIVIESQFANARSFADGMALVNLGGQWIKYRDFYSASHPPIIHQFLLGGKWAYILAPQ